MTYIAYSNKIEGKKKFLFKKFAIFYHYMLYMTELTFWKNKRLATPCEAKLESTYKYQNLPMCCDQKSYGEE